jgi:hypothetical protein
MFSGGLCYTCRNMFCSGIPGVPVAITPLWQPTATWRGMSKSAEPWTTRFPTNGKLEYYVQQRQRLTRIAGDQSQTQVHTGSDWFVSLLPVPLCKLILDVERACTYLLSVAIAGAKQSSGRIALYGMAERPLPAANHCRVTRTQGPRFHLK